MGTASKVFGIIAILIGSPLVIIGVLPFLVPDLFTVFPELAQLGTVYILIGLTLIVVGGYGILRK